MISPVSPASAALPAALSQWLLRMGTGCSPGDFLLKALGIPAHIRGLRPRAWSGASGCMPPQPPQAERLERLAALGEALSLTGFKNLHQIKMNYSQTLSR